MRREIVEGEALSWMDGHPAEDGVSVVTSLPDLSEAIRSAEGSALDFDEWRAWFIAAAARVIRWVPEQGAAIFFQSDIRHRGAWVDKGYMVMRAAEAERASLVWHKIVCRRPPGTLGLGRPTYSHMLCFTRGKPVSAKQPGPDVMPDAGLMTWSRAMGVGACRLACAYLRDATNTRVVVDPFCGRGTVLAVANDMGFDAIGVDLSPKRCRAARTLRISEQ